MSERIYRGPVHNIIRLRTDSAEGRLMVRLVDSFEVQRLRRIKQLGLALFTSQGAELMLGSSRSSKSTQNPVVPQRVMVGGADSIENLLPKSP